MLNERLNKIHRGIKWEVNQLQNKVNSELLDPIYKELESLEEMVYDDRWLINRSNKSLTKWELESTIEKIIESNITEVPYEGTEVDKRGIKEEIIELITKLLEQK